MTEAGIQAIRDELKRRQEIAGRGYIGRIARKIPYAAQTIRMFRCGQYRWNNEGIAEALSEAFQAEGELKPVRKAPKITPRSRRMALLDSLRALR